MSIVSFSLKQPITIVVIVLALFISSILAIKTIPIDIFPKLNLPVIYVIEPYGGMTPQQMEGFFATRLQDQFLYINGIKNVTSKNLQGISILKLTFLKVPVWQRLRHKLLYNSTVLCSFFLRVLYHRKS